MKDTIFAIFLGTQQDTQCDAAHGKNPKIRDSQEQILVDKKVANSQYTFPPLQWISSGWFLASGEGNEDLI